MLKKDRALLSIQLNGHMSHTYLQKFIRDDVFCAVFTAFRVIVGYPSPSNMEA